MKPVVQRLIPSFLIIALAGCLPTTQKERTIDLIHQRPHSELQWEEDTVLLGEPAARRHLAAGWNPPTPENQNAAIWSRGDDSRFEFDLITPRNLELMIRCRCLADHRLPPQEVVLLIGDDVIGRITPDPMMTEHVVALPGKTLRSGRNTLILRYAWARSPRSLGHGRDWRRLAVAVESIEIRGALASSPPRFDASAGNLTLPAGSAVVWALAADPGMSLEVETIEAESGDAAIVVSVAPDAREEREVARWLPGHDLKATLDVESGGPARLIIRNPGQKHGGCNIVLRGLVVKTATDAGQASQDRAVAPGLKKPDRDRLNVVIYLVDALRSDHLGIYGYTRATSPRIDRFAEQALVFEQAWASSSWTRPAVASIFTGLRPEVHMTNRRNDSLPVDITTLPEILRENGYQTAAIVANPNISSTFAFDRGFDTFTLLPTGKRRSDTVHEAASRWLSFDREPSKPFFLYIHTVDPHLPYAPPKKDRELFAGAVEHGDIGSTAYVGTLQARHLTDEVSYAADLIDLYDAEIAANDRSFGRLLDEIDDLGLAGDTIVIFLADHGEEFFDHGGWMHGTSLYSEVLRIPLIMRVPGNRNAGHTAAPAQQTDLMPTILSLLGLSIPGDLQGRDLLEGSSPEPRQGAFLDLDGAFGRSVIDNGWHAVQHGKHGYLGLPELYEISSDPTEEEDLASTFGALPALILGDDRLLMQSDEGRYRSSEAELDEETRKQLEALGYL